MIFFFSYKRETPPLSVTLIHYDSESRRVNKCPITGLAMRALCAGGEECSLCVCVCVCVGCLEVLTFVWELARSLG